MCKAIVAPFAAEHAKAPERATEPKQSFLMHC